MDFIQIKNKIQVIQCKYNIYFNNYRKKYITLDTNISLTSRPHKNYSKSSIILEKNDNFQKKKLTIEDYLKIIEQKDAEIEYLKQEINNLKIRNTSSNKKPSSIKKKSSDNSIKKIGIFPIKKITINPGNEYIKRNCNIDVLLKHSEIILNTDINDKKSFYKNKLNYIKEKTNSLLEKYFSSPKKNE